MPSLKLTYESKITIEVDNEAELQMALRNMGLMGVKPMGFGSAQNVVVERMQPKLIESCSLEDTEKQTILNALDACDGNKVQAAKMLGCSRATLYSKMELYEL